MQSQAWLTRLDAARSALHDPDAIHGAVDVRHWGMLRIRQQKQKRREARWRWVIRVQTSVRIMKQMSIE